MTCFEIEGLLHFSSIVAPPENSTFYQYLESTFISSIFINNIIVYLALWRWFSVEICLNKDISNYV